MEKRASILFCGGCNPRIDRGGIAIEVSGILKGEGFQVSYNNAEAEYFIFLSGCLANCARRYRDCLGPETVVAAATVDAESVPEREIAAHIAKKVRCYFHELEDCL